jgi:hypothetical protein
MRTHREILAGLDALAAQAGLVLDPAWRADIAWYVLELQEAAALLQAFPLTDAVEPAAVFRA